MSNVNPVKTPRNRGTQLEYTFLGGRSTEESGFRKIRFASKCNWSRGRVGPMLESLKGEEPEDDGRGNARYSNQVRLAAMIPSTLLSLLTKFDPTNLPPCTHTLSLSLSFLPIACYPGSRVSSVSSLYFSRLLKTRI